MEKNHFTFQNSKQKLTKRVVILTGVMRSGTTIMGKLLASLQGVELDYETWPLAQLTVLSGAGVLDERTGSDLLENYTAELYYNLLIGRGINLRPSDDSRILNYKPQSDIDRRWKELTTRDDVRKYIAGHSTCFMMKVVNLQPFYSFLYKAFPEGKIIQIIRNPFHVAKSIEQKNWYSDESLEHGESATLKKKIISGPNQGRLIPWWVPDAEADYFLKLNLLNRGFFAWRTLMKNHYDCAERLKPSQYFEIRYEDLLRDPRKAVSSVSDFIGTKFGDLTESLLKTVRTEKSAASADAIVSAIDPKEIEIALPVLRKAGYESSLKDQRTSS